MNYIEFQEKLLNIIKEKMGEDYDVCLHKVRKNNDVELMSIMIQKENDSSPTPTIYLEDFYEQYCTSMTIEDIANYIIGVYTKNCGKINISIDDFRDYEKIKDRIFIKLINYERNVDNLKDAPHIKQFDLAIVYYVLWESDGQRMTTTVRNAHLDMWKISRERLHSQAYINTYSEDMVDIVNMKKLVYDIYSTYKGTKNIEPELFKDIDENTYPMYVITNNYRMFGAAMMLYDKALKCVYEKFHRGFYILPSSIHEVIVVPKTNMSIEEMKEMVTEINENEVDYMEVLSDNVYVYDGERVSMAM